MDVLNIIWDSLQKNSGSVHQLTGQCVESILRNSMAQRSLDNITVVMVSFKSLKKIISKYLKVKQGKKYNVINEQYENENIDISSKDIDEDYMKEILSWGNKSSTKILQQDNSHLSKNRKIDSQRDYSVAISKSKHSALHKEIKNKRYKSNLNSRGKYFNYKENSKVLNQTKFSNGSLQKSMPTQNNSKNFKVRNLSTDENSKC